MSIDCKDCSLMRDEIFEFALAMEKLMEQTLIDNKWRRSNNGINYRFTKFVETMGKIAHSVLNAEHSTDILDACVSAATYLMMLRWRVREDIMVKEKEATEDGRKF